MRFLPKTWWLRTPLGLLSVLLVLLIAIAILVQLRWDRTFDYPVQDVTVSMAAANIARGEYLYKIVSVCRACHSAGGEENPDLLPSGGRKFDIAEIGVIYTRNITPPLETGIGRWSDGEVIRAIREGIGKDGHFLVLMPSELFEGISDNDAQAIVAYLRSLEPLENEVPDFKPSIMGRVLLSFLISPPDRITGAVVGPPGVPRLSTVSTWPTTCLLAPHVIPLGSKGRSTGTGSGRAARTSRSARAPYTRPTSRPT